MKKLYFLLILLFTLNLSAQQIREIILLDRGKAAVVNMKIGNYYVSINTNGNLVELNQLHQPRGGEITSYATSFRVTKDTDITYTDPQSYSSRGDVKFYDNFYSYKSKKLESVSDVKFDYNDNFYSYLNGKLSSIGNMKVTYYDDFYSYRKAKIKSIGDIEFDYYDDFYKYRSGKLKSVKGNSANIPITVFNM